MPAVINHPHPFDPRCGMTLAEMLALRPPAEPEAFDVFWRDTYEQTRATALNLRDEALTSDGNFEICMLRYSGWRNVILGAWLITPKNKSPERFAVIGHGYYHRPLEDCPRLPDTAALYISSRGLSLSMQDGIPDTTAFHVLHGIESRGTYVHRGCVADVWTGASVLLSLYPQATGRLEYAGESFGGGIGAMALPWDDRFAVARLSVPSFGNHPLRLKCPCMGSGEAVRLKFVRHPEIAETLRYFDAAVHAARVTVPTFCACALFDPAVPPPGQFSVFNALAGEKELFVRETGHHAWEGTPDEDEREIDAANAFVLRHLKQKTV